MGLDQIVVEPVARHLEGAAFEALGISLAMGKDQLIVDQVAVDAGIETLVRGQRRGGDIEQRSDALPPGWNALRGWQEGGAECRSLNLSHGRAKSLFFEPDYKLVVMNRRPDDSKFALFLSPPETLGQTFWDVRANLGLTNWLIFDQLKVEYHLLCAAIFD